MTRWSRFTDLTARNILGYGDAGPDVRPSTVDAAFNMDGQQVIPPPDAAMKADGPPIVPPPDADMKAERPPILTDASINNGVPDAITQVGPSYACGPADAGLRCSCGLQPYFPAPVNANGQQQTYVLMPDPATVVSYATLAEFDALAVGRWQRTAGMGELVCEQLGVDFTADHRVVPLVFASDGTVQEVTAQARAFTLVFGTTHPMLNVDNGGLLTSAPIFFDGGQSMYFNYSPWPADYARVAGP
jgi:hypothetical protein